MKLKMFLRQKLMELLVWRINRCKDDWKLKELQKQHAELLSAQMADRRRVNQKEVQTGVWWMTQEELDEHSKRF